jgi:DNA-binding NarL/FixJ family response regulator
MTTKINIVLLVDDSAIVSNRLVSMLEEADNTQVILQATNYTDALMMMESFKPDYVLIDIGLAGKTGMSLLEEMKQRKASKVVVITNRVNRHYKDFCESRGVNCFLDKSIDFELIPGIITQAELN